MGKRKKSGQGGRKGFARTETRQAARIPKIVQRIFVLTIATLLALLLADMVHAVWDYIWVDRQEMQKRIDTLNYKVRFLEEENGLQRQLILKLSSDIHSLKCVSQGTLPLGTDCQPPGQEGSRMQSPNL